MNRINDETSRALVTAAHRLLAESGPDALTVRRIATEAGMSTMNVYSRFGGKDGVIDELYIDGYRRLVAALDDVPVTVDVIADLTALAETYHRFAIDNPTYYDIMFRSSVGGFQPSPEATEVGLQGLGSFARRISVAQAEGALVEPDGRSATEIAAWLWATCHGFVSLELEGAAAGRVSWSDIFADGVRTTVSALCSTLEHARPS